MGMMYWPDSSKNTKASDYWFNSGDDLEWVAETSTPPAGGNNNSNNDGATMLAQGLAAGAALIAAFSF